MRHESNMGGIAAGAMVGAAMAAAGAYLMTQDKRKMRKAAHRLACGCEQMISDVDTVICRWMK